jgi:hypothetical protein
MKQVETGEVRHFSTELMLWWNEHKERDALKAERDALEAKLKRLNGSDY